MAEGKKLLNCFYRPALNQVRTLIKNYISPGGIQYDGFKYYPRHPDFKDPPYTPSKLFLVRRIKPVAFTNPIERTVLQKLNIDGHIKRNGHIGIVKNIPEVNSMLWRIKHLVTIVPITLPHGMPKNGDLTGTYLHSNGRFEVTHRLKIPEKRMEATEAFKNDKKILTKVTVQKFLRDRWNSGFQGSIHEQQ